MMRIPILALAALMLTAGTAPSYTVQQTWDHHIPDITVTWSVTSTPCEAAMRRLGALPPQCLLGVKPWALTILDRGNCHIYAPAPVSRDDGLRVDVLRHELAHCIPGNFYWHN